jgi:hypothetical protein
MSRWSFLGLLRWQVYTEVAVTVKAINYLHSYQRADDVN